MSEPFRAVLDRLGAQVAAVWGEQARWDLEVRTGLLAELVEAHRSLTPAAWSAAISEALKGQRPRSVGAVLLKALRQQKRAPVPVVTERTVLSGLPSCRPEAPRLTPYLAALERLLACAASPEMQ